MNKNFTILIVLIVLGLLGWMLFQSGNLPLFNNATPTPPIVEEPQDTDPVTEPGSTNGTSTTPNTNTGAVTAPVPTGGCYVGGCSSQICSDSPDVVSTCEWREEYACYRNATCERQSDGQCGWTQTSELTMCLNAAVAI